MPQHSIAKENENPALIIANGLACSTNLLDELIPSASLVVVLDKAIERVTNLPITVHIVLGDFDKDFNPKKYHTKENPIEIIHTPNQNKTDLEKAFDYLIERNITAVNVVWATGKRADHTIANITSIISYRDKLEIVILDDHSRIFLLPKEFKKWYPANTPISLIPIGNVTGVCSSNLFYPLQNESLKMGYRMGNSNHVNESGIVTIEHQEGDLLLMECTD